MKYFERIRSGITAILLLMSVWVFIDCQNNIITIHELKGSNKEQYVGKPATVIGIFVKDPLPMLVTDLKVVTVNMPMPYEQYLLLSSKEVDKIDPQKYGGAKIRVSGLVRTVKSEEIKYTGEEVILEVLSYKILEAPEIPYSPKMQDMKRDSSDF